jgi:hypothetical protein
MITRAILWLVLRWETVPIAQLVNDLKAELNLRREYALRYQTIAVRPGRRPISDPDSNLR